MENDMVQEGELLWTPQPEFAKRSQIARYQDWLRAERGIDHAIDDYAGLWKWSVSEPEKFWETIWDYFDVQASVPYSCVLDRRQMPGVKWFENSRVNYAEHMLRHEAVAPDAVVFHNQSETRPLARMRWRELGAQVRILATQLRALGVLPGGRVVSYMPNVPETAIAMMATTAIGAVWSSAAPEFGVKTVIDRFSQIEPKVLFAADGYRFGGKDFGREAEVRRLVALERAAWRGRVGQSG